MQRVLLDRTIAAYALSLRDQGLPPSRRTRALVQLAREVLWRAYEASQDGYDLAASDRLVAIRRDLADLDDTL